MAKTKTEIQNELKILINKANYLPKSEIKRWLLIVDYLNHGELKDTYDHFNEAYEKQRDLKLKMIHEAKLGNKYIQNIGEVSEKYKKQAKEST